jgi:hypothetical protein
MNNMRTLFGISLIALGGFILFSALGPLLFRFLIALGALSLIRYGLELLGAPHIRLWQQYWFVRRR